MVELRSWGEKCFAFQAVRELGGWSVLPATAAAPPAEQLKCSCQCNSHHPLKFTPGIPRKKETLRAIINIPFYISPLCVFAFVPTGAEAMLTAHSNGPLPSPGMATAPVFLPGEFHRLRSLAGWSIASQRVGHD